jgi:hypothetical protein
MKVCCYDVFPAFAMAVCLAVGSAFSTFAAEVVFPLPSAEPIPVVSSEAEAKAALARARETDEALVSDLGLRQNAELVRASTAEELEPGRYRLHALVGSTPQDHILGEAVALSMSATGHTNVFDPGRWFPKAGVLSHVWLDVIVSEPGPLVVDVDWIVGDSKLDRRRYKNEGEARHVYRTLRQNAINQLSLRGCPEAGPAGEATEDDQLDGLLGDLLDTEPPRLQPRKLSGDGLPEYRLLLTGVVLERMSPVSVLAVGTDKPAYDVGESGKVTAEIQNQSSVEATVELQWSVMDDDTPQQILAAGTESLSLQGGQKLSHTFGESFSTLDIAVVGRVKVSVTEGDLRAAQKDIPFVIMPPPHKTYPRDKRIFAHYMGCNPIGYGYLSHSYVRRKEGTVFKHERKDEAIRRGGHLRNYPLMPPDMSLTPEESADLEIRRAMRIGIDGFAIDAWAGGEGAMKVFDTLIRTAEAKQYPFEITICLDPACGGDWIKTVRWLVDNYGDHPKLARRDGKPLVFGYFSQGQAFWFANWKLDAKTDAEKRTVRTSPLGWHLAGAGFRWAERNVGQPIFYHFDYGYLFHPFTGIPAEEEVAALGTIARYVGAVGAFQFQGALGDEKAAAVKAAGAEWSGACGFYQKENIPLEYYIQPGTEFMQCKWADIRRQDATLPQFTSWNDYGESHHCAPAWETRYTLYDLTGYHIEWWKTGKQPVVDHDRVYLIYAKYPRGTEIWPFEEGARKPRKLEVLTILPEAATIRLPGRDIEFEAPAGYSLKQFPLTVGSVIAEVVRDGKVVTRLESPEPITDRPFRDNNGMVCYSTEFMRHWKADFGDAKPFLYGEYADEDNDGLPNWFEMYWFSAERGFKPEMYGDEFELEEQQHPITKWLDFSTMTLVDPEADPDRDGKTNLEEYMERTDPTVPSPPEIGETLP